MPGTELAKAYVQIVPSTEGMKGMLQGVFDKEMPGLGESAGKSAGGGILAGINDILGGKGKGVLESGIASLLTEAGVSSAVAGPIAGIAVALGAGLVKAGAKAAEVTAEIVKGTAEAGLAVAGVGAAGAATLAKSSVEADATFEQVSDGARKIFNEVDYQKMAGDAFSAFKDLNLSANEYFASIVDAGAGFAASMGDKKGYETARRGMIAVSDYAAATGKDINLLNKKFGMISRSAGSYLTIADQFNGLLPQTKEEFLEQAQAAGLLSTEYEKLNAVPIAEYQAALVAMMEKGTENMGIAGKTAEESLSTIQGSLNMTKAAWENLLTGLADPDVDLKQQTDNLLESILGAVGDDGVRHGGLVKNIVPRFKEALTQIGPALKELIPELAGALNELLADEELTNSLLDGAGALIDGVLDNLPTLLDTGLTRIPDLTEKFAGWISTNLPKLSETLLSSLAEHSEELSEAGTGLITSILTSIETATGDESFSENVKGILEPMIDSVVDHLPEWIHSAFASSKNIGQAIWGAISDEISKSMDWVGAFWDLISGLMFGDRSDHENPIETGVFGSGIGTKSPLGSGLGIQSPLGSGMLGQNGLPGVESAAGETTKALEGTDGATRQLSATFSDTGTVTAGLTNVLGFTAPTLQATGNGAQNASDGTGKLAGASLQAAGATGALAGAAGTAAGATGTLAGQTGVANTALGQTQAAGDGAKAGLDNAATGANTLAPALETAGTGAQSLTMTLGTVADSAGQLTDGIKTLPAQFNVMWTGCKAVFVNSGVFFSTVGTASATNFITPWNAVPGQMQGVWNSIKAVFNAAEGYSWGYDLAAQYAAGINAGSPLVADAVTGLAEMIRANLHFSEPDEGPLSDFHTYAPDMMALFAQGVADNEAMVRDQIRRSFDFGEYMTQTGTVTGEAGGVTDLERIIDLLTVISRRLERDGGGGGFDELLDLIDEELGRRARR